MTAASGAPGSARDSLAQWRRLFAYTRPHARGFVLAALGMVVAAATEPMFPAIMKLLLDDGFSAQREFPIWLAPLAIIGIFVARGIATFSSAYAMAWINHKTLVDLRMNLFERMLRLPAREFEREASGVLISRIVFEVQQVLDSVTSAVTTVVRDGLVVIGLFGWLLWLNWKLTLVVVLMVPALAFVLTLFSRRMRRLNRELLDMTGELTRVVEESVYGYKVVKVFGAYDRQTGVFRQTVERLRGFAMRITVAGAVTTPITQLFAAISVSVVVAIALVQSSSSQVTVGGFVSFITAMLMLLAPLKHLADVNNVLQRGLAAADRVFELIDRPIEEDPGTRRLERARGALRFEAVGFRYPGAERAALAGIDLELQPGEMMALVGSSGGGKTTLMNLVPRFLSATEGRVTLDGVPLEEFSLQSLRRQIALVSQDTVLFNDSVRANLCFGRGAPADDALLWSVLRDAALEEFVRALPGGLDANIGERGSRLSGGQRQRLAIARAILRDAPVLLLDEATSALDSRTEEQVQRALERSMQGRTTLVVAHRLSTVRRADRIVVLEGGRIVEQGRHDELMARQGAYARLHQVQGAFEDDITEEAKA